MCKVISNLLRTLPLPYILVVCLNEIMRFFNRVRFISLNVFPLLGLMEVDDENKTKWF